MNRATGVSDIDGKAARVAVSERDASASKEPVGTEPHMTTSEVGKKVVELVRKQAWREAIDSLYGDEVVSVEARGREGEPGGATSCGGVSL